MSVRSYRKFVVQLHEGREVLRRDAVENRSLGTPRPVGDAVRWAVRSSVTTPGGGSPRRCGVVDEGWLIDDVEPVKN